MDCPTRETLTVLTYALGQDVENGHQCELVPIRQLRFTLDEFSSRFISGPNLPAGEELDESIKRILGFQESFKK